MFTEDVTGKPKSATVSLCCDECNTPYRGKLSTARKQQGELGVHQCRRCSSRRAGKKTAAKMSDLYREWYSGDGNFAKKAGVGEKISKALKCKQFTENHKQALRKPKRETEKIKQAANRPEEVERRRQRMLLNNPMHNDGSRKKMQNTIVSRYLNNLVSNNRFKNGWITTSKTPVPIYYRSGLEKTFIEKSSDLGIVDSIESAEYLRIPYLFNERNRVYLPDFKIVFCDKSVTIVEVKNSYMQKTDICKLKEVALRLFCSEVGYETVTINETEIGLWHAQLKKAKQRQEHGLGT